jgi:hypothetical protein
MKKNQGVMAEPGSERDEKVLASLLERETLLSALLSLYGLCILGPGERIKERMVVALVRTAHALARARKPPSESSTSRSRPPNQDSALIRPCIKMDTPTRRSTNSHSRKERRSNNSPYSRTTPKRQPAQLVSHRSSSPSLDSSPFRRRPASSELPLPDPFQSQS